jgi:hypothetical protein
VNLATMERYVREVFPYATLGRWHGDDGAPEWEVRVECAGRIYLALGSGGDPNSERVDNALAALRLAMSCDEADGAITNGDIAAALGLP